MFYANQKKEILSFLQLQQLVAHQTAIISPDTSSIEMEVIFGKL